MALDELLQHWDRDQRLIDRNLNNCFQTLQHHKAAQDQDGENPFEASQDAHLGIRCDSGQPVQQSNGLCLTAAPEICTPLSLAAISWLLGNEPLLKHAAAAAADWRMLSARKALESVCEKYNLKYSELARHSGALGLDVRGIEDHAQRIQQMLEGLCCNDGWTVSHESDLKVLYKHEKGQPYHSVRMEAVLDAPIEHALALAVEFDLVKTWNRYVKESIVLHAKEWSFTFSSYMYGSLWTPFVLFDACVKVEAYDIGEEDRSLLVSLTDMTDEDIAKFGPLPEGHERNRRGIVGPNSCVRIEALPPSEDGRSRTRGVVLAHLDPQVPFVPAFLVNFMLKVASPFAFSMMKKMLARLFNDPTGEYSLRMLAKPEVYAAVRERTKQLMRDFYGIEDYACV